MTDQTAPETTNNPIKLFALFAGNLPIPELIALQAASMPLKAAGARFALVLSEDQKPLPPEEAIADLFVSSHPAPSPFGLFLALEASDIPDVRQLAVVGATLEAIEAGHRAGAGGIIGIAAPNSPARNALMSARPDLIISAQTFATLDQSRFAVARRNRG